MEFAFDRADELGCSTMQIFLTNPRTWLTRKLNSEEAEAFKKRRNESDVNPVVAHMPYLPNLSYSECAPLWLYDSLSIYNHMHRLMHRLKNCNIRKVSEIAIFCQYLQSVQRSGCKYK